MRGSCIACPEDSRNLVLAFSLYILGFNIMVVFCHVDLIDAVMDIIGDLQAFRGIGMMVVVFFWKAYLTIEGTLNGNRPSWSIDPEPAQPPGECLVYGSMPWIGPMPEDRSVSGLSALFLLPQRNVGVG